jgi:hypothetical protein
VGRRWTWAAWSMLAVFVVSMVFATILAVANGTFQRDAANQVVLGFSSLFGRGPQDLVLHGQLADLTLGLPQGPIVAGPV